MADENKQVGATWKQKSFAKAIAKELGIKDFDIKNYDTKEKCFAFIKEHLDEFHRVKTERASGVKSETTIPNATPNSAERKENPADVVDDELPF